MYHFSSMSPHQRQLLERTQSYIRMFCAGLMGFIFVLLMCLFPLHWVRFMVMKDKKKLFAGLWTVCHHDLCWSHVPKAPRECLPEPRAPSFGRSAQIPYSLPLSLSPSHNSAPSFLLIHKHVRTAPPNRVNLSQFVFTRLLQ